MPWLLAAIVLALTGLATLAWGPAEARAALPAFASSRDGVRTVCPPADSGHMRCHALELTAPAGETATGGVAPAKPAHSPPGRRTDAGMSHSARQRRLLWAATRRICDAAYALPKTPVSTQTIAIVTAGGDPTIKKDLANYDSEFGLPGCPGETSCPMVLNGQGKHHLPAVEGNAPLETSLDVEVAHAVCPGCSLLLVEASSASLAAFEEATDTAARLGADEISISWGEAEPLQVVEEGAAVDHPGIVHNRCRRRHRLPELGLTGSRTGTARIPGLLSGRDRGRRHRPRTRAGR